jgi:hypothetical protein
LASLIHETASPAIAGEKDTAREANMDHQGNDHKSVDYEQPHAFVERMNVPFAVPKATGGFVGTAAPEYPFFRDGASQQCAICRKLRSDHIHEASEQAADAEHWPV